MKKIIIGVVCGLVAAGVLTNPAAALDFACPENVSEAECQKAVDELNAKWENNGAENQATETSIEVDPTFSTELNENERSVKFKFGHNLLLTGNNLSSNLENKSGMMFVAGNNLSLSTAAEYGFLAGNTINFAGETVRDLYIAGNSVTLTKDAKLGRDVFVASNTLNVNTNIPGDLAVTAAEVVLKDTKIAGNVNISAAKVEFIGKVEIVGTLTYNDNADIVGLTNASYGNLDAYHVEEVDPSVLMAARVYGTIMSAVGLFLAIAVICALYPKMHDRIEQETNVNRFGVNLAIGLGVLIGAPAVAIFLLCTVIAAPLALILVAVYVIAIYLSQAFTGAWLGHVIIEKLCHARGNIFVEALVGIILLNALSLVPYVGVLTGFMSLLLGLGLIIGFLKPASKKDASGKSSKKLKAKAKAEV